MLPQTAVPKFMDIRVFGRRQLIFYGWWNLKHLLDYWERERCDDSKESASIQKLLREIGKRPTIARIRAIANDYENPTFRIRFDSSKTPIPVDLASKERRPATTTFNCCGWCKYCTAITPVPTYGNCKATGYCDVVGESVRFDTPCILANSSQNTLDYYVRCMKRSLRILKRKKAKEDRCIEYLVKAMREAKLKPPFASWRPLNFFNIGQDVMYFLPSRKFISVKITDISDGVITLQDQQTGHQYYGFMAQPEIITQWEYEYLRQHPYYRKLWIKASRAPQISDAFIN